MMVSRSIFFSTALLLVLCAVIVHAAAPLNAQSNTQSGVDEENCEDTTLDEKECYERAGDRALAQLERDWTYLNQLAHSRNETSLRPLGAGFVAFKAYLDKNCESEGHDALGGSLEDVLKMKCRRDTALARRRLLERVGEAHPLGRTAERLLGRPICNAYLDRTKPKSLTETPIRTTDVEELRRRLDQKAIKAVAEGYEISSIRLLRSTHTEAERLRVSDATFTCKGILTGFCPRVERSQLPSPPTPSEELAYSDDARSDWLSRCQTEILSAYYRRASQRLRQLETQ